MSRYHASLRQSETRGVAQANLAVVLFGLAGVLGTLTGLPAPLITLGRAVFAGSALLVLALSRGLAARPRTRRDGVLLVGQGLLLALHWTAFFQAILVANVAIGLLSFSTFPLFTALLEPLLLRQRPSRLQAVCAVLILPGVFLLVPQFSLHDSVTRGVLWGVLAGATFALLSVTNRWLGRQYAPVTISLYQDGVAALTLLPTLLFLRPIAPLTASGFLALAALGLGCTALAHTVFISSMRDISAQLASLIASLEPVWGIVFALLLLGQVPSARTLIGGALILAATMLPTFGAVLPGVASMRRHGWSEGGPTSSGRRTPSSRSSSRG